MNRLRWEQILIGLGVVFYLFEFPHGIHGDGSARWYGLQHLLATGKFDPIVYSYVHPLVASPLLLLGHLYKDGFWWMSRFNTFFFLASVFYSAHLLRDRWGGEATRAYILLMFCATMFPVHITDFYSEVFSACLILLAILEAQGRRSGRAILFTALSVWNTPGSAVAGAALLAYFAFRTRQWRYFAAVPLLAMGILVENYLKFGVLFPDAYLHVEGQHNYLPYSGGPGFTYPLFFGLLSVFFSFGKGLLFFVPGLLAYFCAPLWQGEERDREFLVAGAVYLAGLAYVFSRWWCWFGGWFWGPRFFLFASILGAVALVGLSREKKLSAPWRWFYFLATALSVWVGCEGVLYGQDFLEDCYSRDPKLEFICHYVPEYSPLWRVFVARPVPYGRKWAYLAYFLLVGGTLLWRPGKKLLEEAGQSGLVLLRRCGRWPDWKF
jgi:hypothetical protein